MPAQGKPQAQIVREAYFVQVPAPDGTVAFHDVTSQLGSPMPFTKPKATCAMQVSNVPVPRSATPTPAPQEPTVIDDPADLFAPQDDEAAASEPAVQEPAPPVVVDPPAKRGVVAFSLLHLTKKAAASVAETPLTIPRGPLARLARHAAAVGDLSADKVMIEVTYTDKDAQSVTLTSALNISRDSSGIVTLDADEASGFELPPRALRISLFLMSPVAGQRVLGVGFIGHLGRPGDPTTLVRVASQVLFSISQLTEFRILSGIETVAVPSAPNRHVPKAVVRKPGDQAVIAIPTRLYSADATPTLIAQGDVVVEIDLEHANPSSNRLMFHVHPDEALTESFEGFRAVFENAVNGLVLQHLGQDDVANITYDIVLGDVDSRTVDRLKEALATMADGLDCTPTQYRNRVPAPV
jgi:hypothetical protein